MSDIWNEEDDKTLDELLEIFEKEDNQETKPEEVKEAKDAIQELQKQMENTQTNATDPEVNLGAFAKTQEDNNPFKQLAKEE